ncbi:MAG: NAD(P)H-hydrate dehydratase [Planctomycetota bacterium]|jgi:NAD(P)H-hydrate epimerase
MAEHKLHLIREVPKLSERDFEAHKGDFGKICIIAGSLGMTGAAAIAGLSALRSGAGLVRVATPKSVLPIVAAIEPCFTTIPLPDDSSGRISAKAVKVILEAVAENDVLAFGPGVGLSTGIKAVLATLLEQNGLRLVIDADGLNNLCKINNWYKNNKAELVLTPHPGEMKRLWASVFKEEMPNDRQDQAARLAEETGTVVVLKGAGTVVSDGVKIYVNTTGNPGMATAGSGDVLTGVITALMGQRLSNFDSAVSGVYVHALAGDIAAEAKGQISLIATDIVNTLPEAFMKLK